MSAPVETELPDVTELQNAIVTLSRGMRALLESRLKRDTIILLISESTKLGKRQVGYVLSALEQLEQTYLKPPVSR